MARAEQTGALADSDPAEFQMAEGQELTDPDDPLDGDEEAQQQLYSLFLKFVAEDRYARMVEVRECAHDRLYWRGMQYIWWSDRDKCFNTTTQGTQSWLNYGDYDIDDMPHFEFVTNIYQAGGLSAIALITGAPPTVRFFPKNPCKYADIATAKGFDKLTKQIERWNPPKLLLQDAVYYMWTDGVIGFHTQYVKDPETLPNDGSFNVPSAPALSEQPETVKCQTCGFTAPAAHFVPPVPCPECGNMLTQDNIAPADDFSDITSLLGEESPEQTEEAASGRQIINVCGALELRRPQCAKKQSDFHYLSYDKEVHYTSLREEFPSKAKKILPGTAFGTDDTFERNARLAVAEGTNLLTQTAGALASLCTRSEVWFRRSAFTQFQNDGVGDKFRELFPRGCKVVWAGPIYLTSRAESMDDCWVIRHVMPGEGQHRNGMGTSMVSVQDRFNTETNIRSETYEYGIPRTFFDSSMFDQEAESEQRSEPGADVFVNLPNGQDIRTKIMQIRADSVSMDMVKDLEDMRGPVMQLLTGEYPAAIGNPDMGTETAKGMIIQRDQAMGRMGIPYGQLKQASADIMTLACYDFRRNHKGMLHIPKPTPAGDFDSESIDVTALDGNALAYPEGDEAFPELWNQQRATLMEIADHPLGTELMKDPENARVAIKLIGIKGLQAPGEVSEEKQLREINEMLQGTPIDVDPDVDEHVVEADTCQHFLRGKEGQDLKRENPQAYDEVRQHMLTHRQVAAQQQASAPPPMKPISANISVPIKDMTPIERAAVAKDMGIQETPAQILMHQMVTAKAKAKPAVQPPGAGSPPPQAENAGRIINAG